jgi:glycosyltransferase involved in cell wall biosynthesis
MALIGVDARALAGDGAGRSRIMREVLPRMVELLDGDSLVLYGAPGDPFPDLPDGAWEFSIVKRLWHVAVGLRATAACDVLFSANTYISPLFARIPSATIVCDLVAFERFEDAHPRARINERITLPLAVHRCGRLFCISDSTALDLISHFPSAAAKVQVTPLAASERFSQAPPDSLVEKLVRNRELPPQFVLAVGTIEPRKNIVRLIDAHNRLPTELRGRHPLVIAGQRGWVPGPFDAAAASAKGPIHVLGYVSDAELNVLYRRCSVFCYPSLYEGFGLPVLEAMTAGAAVITSNVSSLPEVAGGAARLVDPTDVGAIEAALRSLLSDPDARAEHRRRGKLQAARFSWWTTAQRILDGLRSLAAKRR